WKRSGCGRGSPRNRATSRRLWSIFRPYLLTLPDSELLSRHGLAGVPVAMLLFEILDPDPSQGISERLTGESRACGPQSLHCAIDFPNEGLVERHLNRLHRSSSGLSLEHDLDTA